MKNLLIIPVLLGLGGCGVGSNTERDFLCEAQLGSPCSTISQADGQGRGTASPITEHPVDTLSSTISQEPLLAGKPEVAYAGMPDGGFAYETGRYRVPELIGRVWIAPYLDEDALLHESQYVHFVIQDAHWAQR